MSFALPFAPPFAADTCFRIRDSSFLSDVSFFGTSSVFSFTISGQ